MDHSVLLNKMSAAGIHVDIKLRKSYLIDESYLNSKTVVLVN